MTNAGIYKIICVSNNKCYIGSAVDLNHRFRTHKSKLNLNSHKKVEICQVQILN